MPKPGDIVIGEVILPFAVQATIAFDADGEGVDRTCAIGFLLSPQGPEVHFQLTREMTFGLMEQLCEVAEEIYEP